MLKNPQIAKITAAKKRRASHHGIPDHHDPV
jgi:hypothetical protein